MRQIGTAPNQVLPNFRLIFVDIIDALCFLLLPFCAPAFCAGSGGMVHSPCVKLHRNVMASAPWPLVAAGFESTQLNLGVCRCQQIVQRVATRLRPVTSGQVKQCLLVAGADST